MSFIPIYILVIFLTIIVDYFAGIWIEKSQGKVKKFFLIYSITITVLILFVFKYFNFFNANIAAIAEFFDWNYGIESLKLILPIGLSFHTFQSMSYIIEVYRGKQKAERNFGIYALYVMFYPQLVAGPIERPQNLLHQFYEEHKPETKRIIEGIELMTWGFLKKIVIADRFAIIANTIYSNPHDYSSLSIILASIAFAIQIYCDFSGYSDIAIGAARVMGFNLMKNFRSPYFSRSIPEFWNRWHISLSSWFRDYLYRPLTGGKISLTKLYFSVFIVFIVSGIWHGANWTFIIWGALHGIYMVSSIIMQPFREKISNKIGLARLPKTRRVLQSLLVLSLVLISWVFFRSNTVSDAFYILKQMLSIKSFNLPLNTIISIQELIFGLIVAIGVFCLESEIGRKRVIEKFRELSWWIRAIIHGLIIIFILLFGVFLGTNFIYFQF